MANESIRAAFERMWQHTTTALSNKASGVLNQAKEYTDSQRIGYTDIIRDTVLLPHMTITVENGEWYKEGALGMVAGESYLVELDDVEYICECTGINATENHPDFLLLGDISLVFDEFPSNNFPFALVEDLMNGMIAFGFGSKSDDGTHTLSVWHINVSVHQIDPKYIPSTTPNVQTAQVGQTVVVKAVDEHGVPTKWEAVDNPDILSEVTETLTFDGDLTDKIVRDYDDMTLVKVSDIPIDPDRVVSVTTRLTDNINTDQSGTLGRHLLFIEKEENGVAFIGSDDGIGVYAVVFMPSILDKIPEDDLETMEEAKAMIGTYVRYKSQGVYHFYTKQIEYAVDKIDQKYLPGVCLPVVEFTTQPTTEGAPLTAAEVQAIVSAGMNPLVIKFAFSSWGDPLNIAAMASCVSIKRPGGGEERAYLFRAPGMICDFCVNVGIDENGESVGDFSMIADGQNE